MLGNFVEAMQSEKRTPVSLCIRLKHRECAYLVRVLWQKSPKEVFI